MSYFIQYSELFWNVRVQYCIIGVKCISGMSCAVSCTVSNVYILRLFYRCTTMFVMRKEILVTWEDHLTYTSRIIPAKHLDEVVRSIGLRSVFNPCNRCELSSSAL